MSTPAHTALSVQHFLTKNNMTLMPHPPYSPDLTSSDFFMFFHMRKVLRGKRFAHVEEVKPKITGALKGMKIYEFKNCFEQWEKVSTGVLHQMESTLKVTEV